MAICITFDGQGVSADQYDEVLEKVGGELPEGGIFHIAHQTDDGFRVVEIWESEEAARRFFEERLGQAIQEAGIQPWISQFEVHNYLEGPAMH